MRKKILVFLIGFIIGIGIFLNYENLNPRYILGIGLILSIILILLNKKYLIFALALPLGFMLSLNTFNHFELRYSDYETLELTIIEKRIMDEGYRYFVRARNNDIDEKSVFFSKDDFEIGDMILADAKIKEPNTNTNPNLFSYRKYLASKSIASELTIEKILIKDRSDSKALGLRRGFYNYIHNIFDNNLSEDSGNFIVSVILGENLLENTDIRELGLSHILAVSGLHIDLLLAFIIFVLTKANINYKHAYLIGLLTCLTYAYIIGFPFSVIRVLIINTIAYLAFLFSYPEDKIKSLLFAASLILLFNPFAILNSGYILSFVATSGVYIVYPKIKRYLPDNLISNSLGFTGAIQLTLLPFIIYYNGNINLISIIANFLIVPIFTIAMYLIFLVIISYPLIKFLLWPIFKIIDYLIYSLLNLTSLLNSFSIFNIDFAHPHIFIVAYAYVLLLVLLLAKRTNKKLLRNFYSASLFIILLSIGYERLNPEISFSMIDIGQGDAFILNDGGDYYLFDVGGPKYKEYDSGERILVPYLKSLGIKDIKAVFISHEDKDHAGNIDILYENFNVENLITNKYNIDSFKRFNPKIMKLGDVIKLKNSSIKCVYEGIEGNENAESLGLLIDIGGIKILTLGDLDSSYEDELNISADILKVSHHGSRKSTSKDFVKKLGPKLALISAGRNNTYGHPSNEVLENLDSVKVYNTQVDGLVKIKFAKNIKMETYLKGGYFK